MLGIRIITLLRFEFKTFVKPK